MTSRCLLPRSYQISRCPVICIVTAVTRWSTAAHAVSESVCAFTLHLLSYLLVLLLSLENITTSIKLKGGVSLSSPAMIRLPATTIVLGGADIKDFESRRKHVTQEGRRERTFHQDSDGILLAPQVVPIRVRDKSLYGSVEQLTALETYMPGRPQHDDNKECSTHDVEEINSDDSGSSSSSASTTDHPLTGSVENVTMDTPTFSASKDNFEYGGYTEQSVATNIESPAIPHGKFLVPQMQHYTNVLDDSLCGPEVTIHRAPKTSTTTGQIPLGHLA